jgi:DNA-binding transcriptional ArsR family regulator
MSGVDLFTAIAEPHRRDILDALVDGEKAVGTLVAGLALAQPQVSKHLRVLSEVGLVRSRADGRRRLYSVDPRPSTSGWPSTSRR